MDLLVELDPDAGLGFGIVSVMRELDWLLDHPVGLTFASRLRASGSSGISSRSSRPVVHEYGTGNANIWQRRLTQAQARRRLLFAKVSNATASTMITPMITCCT